MNDYIARMALLRGIRINYEQTQKAEEEIRDLYELGACGALVEEPGFIVLRGRTGSGKSTIVRNVMEKLKAEAARLMPPGGDGQVIQPIVFMTLPEETTRKNVCGELLAALGDDDPFGATQSVIVERIKAATEARKVRMIIIDEIQHIVSADNARVNYKAADLLKVLIETLRVPFLLVGTPRMNKLLEAKLLETEDNQLLRRMHTPIDLEPFSVTEQKFLMEFRAFLRCYDEAMPFEEWCHLWDKDIALAIHKATDGFVGFVAQLLKKAGDIAIRAGGRRIEIRHLSEAYLVVRAPFVDKGRRNPFEGLAQPAPQPKSATRDRAA